VDDSKSKTCEHPFGCGVFHPLVGPPHRLCPSCSRKRTLLRLPHRQFVFALPRALGVLFRRDKRLHGKISRLIYALVRDFAAEAAGKPLRTAAQGSRIWLRRLGVDGFQATLIPAGGQPLAGDAALQAPLALE
jgi:hypothetical protein